MGPPKPRPPTAKELNMRQVKLHKGPADGAVSIASHNTAFVSGELYVWDGTESGADFVHAVTALRALPDVQREEERKRVEDWDRRCAETDMMRGQIPPPMAELIGIPPWRINAWAQVIWNEVAV